jgi:hypothetical protein
MRKIGWLVVMLLVAGCGILGPSPSWPGVITSFGNLTPTQQQQLTGYANDMNAMSGETLIKQENNSAGYPISITIAPPPASSPNRAGYTVRDNSSCNVQFADFLLQDAYEPYFESVFMHEIGHCRGLVHVATQGAIMFPVTNVFSTYPAQAFTDFFQTFENASGGGSISNAANIVRIPEVWYYE